jgi:hypothetical protein
MFTCIETDVGEPGRRAMSPERYLGDAETASCTKWLTVGLGSKHLQMREAICVDKIRA